jgi:hypothetical protein
MYTTKPIALESVPSALAKAERYRLLNEPGEAESICQDILRIQPGNEQARIMLFLALTDQIPQHPQAFTTAMSTIADMDTAYDRAYYSGIAWERRAKARHAVKTHGSSRYVFEWITTALRFFEEAEKLRTPGNDDSVLRWNACVRFLEQNEHLQIEYEELPDPIASE